MMMKIAATSSTDVISMDLPAEVLHADDVLTKALLEMTVDDRNAVQEEIHGVRSMAVQETPALIQQSLESFQNEIDRIFSDLDAAGTTTGVQQQHPYRRMMFRRSLGRQSLAKTETFNHYALDDPNFRLRFLRTLFFDVPEAVKRFLSYLEYTHTLWGDVVLDRPVMLKDILANKEDRKFLKKGYFQILPFRDQSGRKVLSYMGGGVGKDANGLARSKVIFYLLDVATRDCMESQRLGCVTVSATHAFPDFSASDFRRKDLELMAKTFSSLPTRLVGIHICIPNTIASRLLSALWITDGRIDRGSRYRLTVGSELECWYALRSYGIPSQLFQLTETGNIKLGYFNQWMKTRMLQESQNVQSRHRVQTSGTTLIFRNGAAFFERGTETGNRVVECPGANDVVFRQGTPSLNNPGNCSFRDLIFTYLEERETRSDSDNPNGNENNTFHHRSENSGEKAVDPQFRDWLITEIEVKRGGRFLEWDKELLCWIKMENSTPKEQSKIRQKVSFAIYNFERTAQTMLLLRRSRNEAVKADAQTSPHELFERRDAACFLGSKRRKNCDCGSFTVVNAVT